MQSIGIEPATVAFQPVAIVGVAAELPGAGDLDALAALVEQRRDLVGVVPPERRADAGMTVDEPLAECALLDRVDAFDHAFFGLSLREARQMDPQQRALLELSCRAIWDGGRSLTQLRGSRTAVVFGAAAEEYSTLLDPAAQPMVTGLLPAAQAGRVAHALDLRGPAAAVDTACSSSLSAVLDACRRLGAGEVEWALAGGVRLFPVPPSANEPGAESIVSPGGRSRSFDAAADGTGLGEGGAVFLLKLLSHAQADGDPVHAVIIGGASNHDGGRSNGFAAPSAEAQEELLLTAWQSAGVHPNSVGFIEAHGTGTRLGDPIEFQALTAAFVRRTGRTGFCVLSSVKSNLGHLDSAAGAAGLAKAIVALREGRRYASAHFTTPNPLLETGNSALVLSSATESWETSAQRRAGVSSFGLTGTNVHLVVEQAPPVWREDAPAVGELVIPVAARSAAGLRSHARVLADHLRAHPERFADAAAVQALGRDHERVRACVRAATAEEAVAALDRIADGDDIAETTPAVPVLLLPHEDVPVDAAAWATAFPALGGPSHPMADRLAPVRALIHAGVSDRIVIGSGSGNLLLDILRGETDAATAAANAASLGVVAPPDAARVDAAMTTIAAQGRPVCVTPWRGGLVDVMGAVVPRHDGESFAFDADAAPRTALADLIAALYRTGVDIDWAKCVDFLGGYGRRSSVPTALFERTRCWVEKPYNGRATARPAEPVAEAVPVHRLKEDDGTPAEIALAAIWCDVLETESVSRDDDFFDLGGDSLMQVQLENAIQADFGIEIAFDAFYDHTTLRELAAHIAALAPVTDAGGPTHDPGRDRAPATHSQRRMWLLQQLAPDSGAYNVAAAYELDGPVDVDTLRAALDALAARHGVLRTRLVLEDGELVQRVEPPAPFDLTVATLAPGSEAADELRAHAARPFDLAAAGAARGLLLRDGDRAWLQLVLHHAICDEQSMGLLLDDLVAHYAALRDDTPPPAAPALQFVDWAAWEHGQERAQDADYWLERLRGAPTELPLPTDFPYGAQQDYRGAWLDLEVPAELVKRVREEARTRNGTLFTWLMTAYAAWLARLTQAEDFIVGVPIAGRHRVEAENLPGCFINTLALRVDASGDPSFTTLFDRVRAGLVGAFAHQRHPFDVLVEQVGAGGDAARPPLVQTLLSLQGAGGDAERRLGEAAMSPVQVDTATSWFDLSAVLWEEPAGGLGGILAYCTALFEQATAAAFRRDWLALIEAGLTEPHESIHTLLEEDSW
ncbi:condensation domain-containing protein [Kibdelosporangium philippinense]|uniref:Condensation domain-containing protein n=1 Tax=Kibdelosporangium philippinense TaxID=211113 RepID=A0ABS8Z1Y3_9PSEU|nr:condensation domain-containing protein [Kibdelosporangium philippinense]MCE7001951.1 condensation domain-containing protein [Kibdelosporangium philippinense]